MLRRTSLLKSYNASQKSHILMIQDDIKVRRDSEQPHNICFDREQ